MSNITESLGTKKVLGILLPDWVDEDMLKKLVYSFLGLVVAILVSSVFIWPKFNDLYGEEKELGRLEKSLDILSSSFNRVESFESNLGFEEVSSLQLATPQEFDPGLILFGLRQVSNDAGVILESYALDDGVILIDADDMSKNKDLVSLKGHSVVVKLVGVSDKLIRFIDLLGSSLPFSVITDLSLSEVSDLLTEQGLSQLEMGITYFESKTGEVTLDKVVEFTPKNKQLLEEITLYSRPSTISNSVGNQVQRRGSLFGF